MSRALDAILRRISGALALSATALLLMIAVATSADVAKRTITGSGIHGIVEATEILLVGTIFFGLAQGQRSGAHVTINLFIDRYPAIRPVARRLSACFAVLVTLWFTYATASQAHQSWAGGEYTFGLLRIPVWPARLLIFAGFLFWTLELLRSFAVSSQSGPAISSAVSERANEAMAKRGLM